MTAQFELEDFVLLQDYRLTNTNLITPEEQKREGGATELKIQLFFTAPKYNKSTREVLQSNIVEALSAFTKVKLPEAAFKELLNLGLTERSTVTMRCVPNAWSIFDKDKKPRLGVWFQLDSLLKLDGRDINYRVILPKQFSKTNAFDYFNNKGGDTARIEAQFNSELDSYLEA